MTNDYIKHISKFLILSLAFSLWACAPKPPVVTKVEDGEALFSSAEKMFEAKSYGEALERYNEYLSLFPDRPMAGAVLMKMGTIYTTLGKNEDALIHYKRLIAEYPDNPFVPDATVEILVRLYDAGQYEELIKESDNISEKITSRVLLFKAFVLLGDTHMAIGSPSNALNYYIMAYKKSTDYEKESVIIKLKKAAKQLDTQDIISLLGRLKDDGPTGYLLFQLGLNNVNEKKYKDAESALSELVDRFPEHENAREAKSLIEKLNKNFIFNHHTIGCLLPLSGPYKTYGNRALRGIELALDQFSSENIHPLLKVVIKDTQSDPDQPEMAVKELLKEKVAAIIGPVINAEPAAKVAQNKGIPIITLTQKGDITDSGDLVFRNFLTPGMQINSIVSYAMEDLGLNSFAILYPDENYGITFMNLFWDEVIARGGKVVGVESYNPDHTDFADPVKKLVGLYYELPENIKNSIEMIAHERFDFDADEGIDIIENEEIENNTDEEKDIEEEPEAIIDFDGIFIPDAPKKAGLIIPQLAFYDVKDVYLFGTNLWHSGKLIKMTRQYVQGAVMADGFFAESTSEKVKDFVRVFQQTYGEKPGFVEAVAYDTAMMLFHVVSRPDIYTRSSIKDKLIHSGSYQGITGTTSFDINGEALKKLYLLKIKGNRFVEIKRD